MRLFIGILIVAAVLAYAAGSFVDSVLSTAPSTFAPSTLVCVDDTAPSYCEAVEVSQ